MLKRKRKNKEPVAKESQMTERDTSLFAKDGKQKKKNEEDTAFPFTILHKKQNKPTTLGWIPSFLEKIKKEVNDSS